MGWFSSRRKDTSAETTEDSQKLAGGIHRSPGVALISQQIARRPPRAILDLGASANETVNFFSSYCTNISIQGLFQSSGAATGVRSEAFRFSDEVFEAFPDSSEHFDLVLLWDLLHYLGPALVTPFVARLAELCHRDALVMLLASANTPIPLTPIRFKIHDQETLEYHIEATDRGPSPELRTRDVEQIMTGFTPVRLFQLRNGLQEFVFRFDGPSDGPSESEAGDAIEAKVAKEEDSAHLFFN